MRWCVISVIGTTKAKTKLPLDFIGLPGISGYYMYEVRKFSKKGAIRVRLIPKNG